MNVAILAAMLSNSLNLTLAERNDTVIAALFHDMGKLNLPIELVLSDEKDNRDEMQIRNMMLAAFSIFDDAFPSNPAVKRICIQYSRMKDSGEKGKGYEGEDKILPGARILHLADTFDAMTAMRYGLPPASEVAAIKYILERPQVFPREIVDALIGDINILNQGVSVELNNGDKALVLAENTRDILRPMVLNFRDNKIIDLHDKSLYGNIEIVDIMKTLDNRHVLDLGALKNQGIAVDEPEFIVPR
jgi:hypothetical protein